MALRLTSVLVILLAVPAVPQTYPMNPTPVQTGMNQRIEQRESNIPQVNATPAIDLRAARLQELHNDIGELSRVSALVQSDLRQLQTGVLPKSLDGDLKKLEKLSKRIRSEMQ